MELTEVEKEIVAKQLEQIMRGDREINCGTCHLGVPLWKLYRCYYCGVWFCEKCSPGHFEGVRPTFRIEIRE